MKELTVRQQANRIRKWYGMATSEQLASGATWYDEAHTFCVLQAMLYDISTIQVANLVAVLSPQKRWAQNKAEVKAMLLAWFKGIKPSFNYYASKRTLDECKTILMGTFLVPPSRLKTYAFASNIAYKDSSEVTIDRHAIQVARDDMNIWDASHKILPRQYKAAAQAYTQVAASLGIKAYQLQAICWVTYKSVVGR